MTERGKPMALCKNCKRYSVARPDYACDTCLRERDAYYLDAYGMDTAEVQEASED